MAAIQRVAIDRHHSLVMAESGNSLRLGDPLPGDSRTPGDIALAPASERWVIAPRASWVPHLRVAGQPSPLSATVRR